jgi:hypothetical protein
LKRTKNNLVSSGCHCSRHEGSGPADLRSNWEEEKEEKPSFLYACV